MDDRILKWLYDALRASKYTREFVKGKAIRY